MPEMHEGKRHGEGDENRRGDRGRNAVGGEPKRRGRKNERKCQNGRQHTVTLRKEPEETLGEETKGISSRKKRQEIDRLKERVEETRKGVLEMGLGIRQETRRRKSYEGDKERDAKARAVKKIQGRSLKEAQKRR